MTAPHRVPGPQHRVPGPPPAAGTSSAAIPTESGSRDGLAELDGSGELEGSAEMDGSGETTRDRIMRTAGDLFADRGYQRTSLQQIADRLRLTKAAILYHFPSKEHLVGALVEPLIAGLEQAVERASGHPPEAARWVMLEAWVDTMLAHRRPLGMLFHDISMLTRHGGMYPRIMSVAMRAYAIVAGPDATLSEQVRAVQAVATLGDPVVFFEDIPADRLRAEMLAGVRRLLGDGGAGRVAPPVGAARPATSGATVAPDRPRRAGRPRAMDAARVGAARSMLAAGSHTVDEIATVLGVSRATVYRYLRSPEPSQNQE